MGRFRPLLEDPNDLFEVSVAETILTSHHRERDPAQTRLLLEPGDPAPKCLGGDFRGVQPRWHAPHSPSGNSVRVIRAGSWWADRQVTVLISSGRAPVGDVPPRRPTPTMHTILAAVPPETRS
jgi:hypothetical protein